MAEREKIQMYECRLRRSGVLRVSDVAGERSIGCAEALARAGHALTRGVPHEQLWVLLLNARNGLEGAIRVSEGGLHGTAVKPSDILRVVLASGQGAFALCHNHPSGDPRPSQADREVTRAVHDAAEVVGLVLLDHVIVTRDAGLWHGMGERGDQ